MIIEQTVQIAYKLLPITLTEEGSATVGVRRGLLHEDGTWEFLDQKMYQLERDTVNAFLQDTPTPGLTRYADLAQGLYTYLLSHGAVIGTVE